MTAVVLRDAPAAKRLCAGCVTEWAVEPQVNLDARDSLWRCPSCSAERPRLSAAPLVPGSRCTHADYQSGPFSVLLVTATEPPYVTAHPLGFPSLPGPDGRSRYHRGELLAVAR